MKKGDRLHTFTILEELGHGGMGYIYLGVDERTSRKVAIKTLFEEYAKDEGFVRRFLREAQIYRKLNHPNIVKFVASGFDNDIYWIALEHVDGETLDKIIKTAGPLPVMDALYVMEALASAVAHAHSKGIIHRDIKPRNVMLGKGGVVKLLDFGVAQLDDDLVKTASGSVIGTFFYSSPEQNQGKKADERSDLYSLGLVFYEMLTGKRALQGSSLLEVAAMQAHGDIPPPSRERAAIPPVLDKIVMKLIEREAAARYQTAEALLGDIRKCRELLSGQAGGAAGVQPPPKPGAEEAAAYLEKAKAAFGEGKMDLALQYAREGLKHEPQSLSLLVVLGKVYAAKNQSFNCIEAFKKAVALSRNDPMVLQDYAIALFSLKLFPQAKEQFEKLRELAPDNELAVSYLSLIQKKLDGKSGAGTESHAASHGRSPIERVAAFTDQQVGAPDESHPDVGALLDKFIPKDDPVKVQQHPAALRTQQSRPSMERGTPLQRVVPPPPPPPPLGNASLQPHEEAGTIGFSRAGGAPVSPPAGVASPPPPPPPPAGGMAGPGVPGQIPAPGMLDAGGAAHVPPPPPPQDKRDGRLPSYIPPPRRPAVNEEPRRQESHSAERPRRRRRGRSITDDDLRPVVDPAKARLISLFWWGGGHLYTGQSSNMFVVTLIQLMLICLIGWPFTPYWHDPNIDFQFLYETCYESEFLENIGIKDFVCEVVRTMNLSPWSDQLERFLHDYAWLLLVSLSGLIYLYWEMTVPRDVYLYAVLSNLTGKVLEVRKDLSIKINLGEERGVQVGQIFEVQKKKHIDQVQALNFKTMIMPPKRFPIGEAKVISTTPHFAVCKFRRLPGETSSPSIGDRVVLKRG